MLHLVCGAAEECPLETPRLSDWVWDAQSAAVLANEVGGGYGELHTSCISAGSWWLEAAPSEGPASYRIALAVGGVGAVPGGGSVAQPAGRARVPAVPLMTRGT